jgi:AraC-like DNA-binding protein
MESVRKALWLMESRFAGEVSLDELSQAAGISRCHFAHVFARATGQSAMRYIRGRRLSEAARVLANGGPDILSVALDFGYGSHEAFTRAFRDQFGLTPESVRARRHLDNVNLVLSGFSDLPAEFARLRIPAQRYAMFTHREHVSTMRNVAVTIWTKWLPESGYEAVDAPYLEYYGEEFDGKTGMGGFQMWIPIKTQS